VRVFIGDGEVAVEYIVRLDDAVFAIIFTTKFLAGGSNESEINKEALTATFHTLHLLTRGLAADMCLHLVVNIPKRVVIELCREAVCTGRDDVQLPLSSEAEARGPHFRFQLLGGANGPLALLQFVLGCGRSDKVCRAFL